MGTANINGINIEVKNGNIAEETVDCIVVPEFDSCSSHGGVGYAIEAAGMGEGLDKYDEEIKKHGKLKIEYGRPVLALELGHAVITESGKKGMRIAHVVTAGADENNQVGVVNDAIFNTLVAANEAGITSIAIPELGTGIIGFLTQEQSAKAIFNAIHRFSTEYPSSSIQNVSLVVFRGSISPAEKVLESYTDFQRTEKGKQEFNPARFILEWGPRGPIDPNSHDQ